MATYDFVFDALGLQDWCEASGDGSAPMSMDALVAKSSGEEASTSIWDLPFPSMDALNEAIAKHGPREIMNTDSHTIGASSRVSLDHNAERSKGAHHNGWTRTLSGQHLHRTAVAEPEARGDLSRRDQ